MGMLKRLVIGCLFGVFAVLGSATVPRMPACDGGASTCDDVELLQTGVKVSENLVFARKQESNGEAEASNGAPSFPPEMPQAEGKENDEEEDEEEEEEKKQHSPSALYQKQDMNIGASMMSEGEKQAFVDAHNIYRCMHGAPPVRWSNAVANNAYNFIKNMRSMQHSNSYDLSPPAGPAGENLYQASSKATAKSVVSSWYNEVSDCYNSPKYITGGCKSGRGVTGHFTAMIWKGVKEIGCARSNANSGLVVCRYKAGNHRNNDTPNMPGGYEQNVKSQSKSKSECKSGGSGGSVYTMAKGKKCGLEWDGNIDGNQERKAKWDCRGHADPVIISGNKIYAMAGGKKCGLEWDGHMDGNQERKAKWDCRGHADSIFISGNKIYAMAGGKKCGLEWDGNIDGNQERKAKWDCRGHADPIFIK